MAALGSPPKTRQLGLLLIVVVLFAVTVIPNLSTRVVSGAPQAVPVPDPPAVGSCVTDPIDPSWDWTGPGFTPKAGVLTTTYPYPPLGISQCQGSRYGEVAAVIPNLGKPVMTITSDGDTDSTSVMDPNLDTCELATDRYVGIAVQDNEPLPLLGVWSPTLQVGSGVSTPSTRQQAAGQSWLACIVFPLTTDAALTDNIADQERYADGLRNALFTGNEHNRVGTCIAGSKLTDSNAYVGCSTVHHSEVFAVGDVGSEPISRADLQRDCGQVVRRLTGIPDVSKAGFTVQISAYDVNRAQITDPSVPAGASLTCAVTADGGRKLNGSLLALGSIPIPWA